MGNLHRNSSVRGAWCGGGSGPGSEPVVGRLVSGAGSGSLPRPHFWASPTGRFTYGSLTVHYFTYGSLRATSVPCPFTDGWMRLYC